MTGTTLNPTATPTTKVITPMTREQIMSKCPNLFATSHCTSASDKYTQINIYNQVIQPLEAKGWFIRAVDAENSKKFGKHGKFLVRMSNHNHIGSERSPEILIYSSHNKTASVSFRMGIFEFVCSNGLVIARDEVSELKSIRIRHIHEKQVEEKLAKVMSIVDAEISKMDTVIEKMKIRILTETEQVNLALQALEFRGIVESGSDLDVAVRSVLATAKNTEGVDIASQNGDSLFNVFQRIQGNLTKGNAQQSNKRFKTLNKKYDAAKLEGDSQLMAKIEDQLRNTQQYRKVRKMTNLRSLTALNEKLFASAYEVVAQ